MKSTVLCLMLCLINVCSCCPETTPGNAIYVCCYVPATAPCVWQQLLEGSRQWQTSHSCHQCVVVVSTLYNLGMCSSLLVLRVDVSRWTYVADSASSSPAATWKVGQFRFGSHTKHACVVVSVVCRLLMGTLDYLCMLFGARCWHRQDCVCSLSESACSHLCRRCIVVVLNYIPLGQA